MKLLLDTHAFIWCDSEPAKLSLRAQELCQDPDNTLILSVASVWEMQIKLQLGKMQFKMPLPDMIRQQQENGVEVLPVHAEHVFALDSLPAHHKDPFDRLLVAQAIVEGAAIITTDPLILQYPVKVEW